MITLALLIILNISVIKHFKQSTNPSAISQSSDKENFAQEFGLNNTSSYYDKTVK